MSIINLYLVLLLLQTKNDSDIRIIREHEVFIKTKIRIRTILKLHLNTKKLILIFH